MLILFFLKKKAFVIYADFESCLVPISSSDPVNTSKVVFEKKHVPMAFAAKTICKVDETLTNETFVYAGKEADSQFVNYLMGESKRIDEIYNNVKKISMTNEDVASFNEATVCHMCKKPFETSFNYSKVRDHGTNF